MQRGNTLIKNYPNNHQLMHSPSFSNKQMLSPHYQNGTYSNSNDVVISKYMNIINGLREELRFLSETNSNLLVELRESQDANYVLTEELRRSQRSCINTLDELQACQTANTVLREELQRLELNSVKITREVDKYKKANKLLREEIRDLKSTHFKRQDSIKKLQEKAQDIQNQLSEEDSELKGVSSLKEAIDSIADSVENTSLNGYIPTDSDNESLSFNSDIDDRSSLNSLSKKERVLGRRVVGTMERSSSHESKYKYETAGLFTRKQMHNSIEFHIEDADNEPQNRVNGRRGTLEDILDEKHKNGNGREDINKNYQDAPLSGKKFSVPEITIDDSFCDKLDINNNNDNNFIYPNYLPGFNSNIRMADKVDHDNMGKLLKLDGLFFEPLDKRYLVSF